MSTGSPDFDQAVNQAAAEWEAALAAQRNADTANAGGVNTEPSVDIEDPARVAITSPAPETVPPVAPVETVAEAATPVTPETPPAALRTMEEIEEAGRVVDLNLRLAEARKQYLKKKLEWERSQGLLQSTFVQNAESRAQLKESLDGVEAEYKSALAELLALRADKAMDEGLILAEQKAHIISREAGPKQITAWYKKLGESSIAKNYNGPAKGLVKWATSNRMLANASLIGLGVLVGPGGALGVYAGQKFLSGFMAGMGSRDVIKSGRMKYLQRDTGPVNSIEEIDSKLESLLARAALDGTIDRLYTTESYIQLIAQRNELTRNEYAQATPEQRAVFVERAMMANDDELNKKINSEKNWNKTALVTGVAAGVFVGSGKMMELLRSGASNFNLKWPNLGIKGWFTGSDTPPAARPNLESFNPAEPVAVVPTEVTAPSGPEVGVIAGEGLGVETALQVGSRGIEGALLDHLKTPEGAKMMEWLQAQEYNQGVTDKGALVHRFVSDYAKEHGFNIDQGGGKDLSKIFGAEIKVGADGAISLGVEDKQFMPASAATAEVLPDTEAEHLAESEPASDVAAETSSSNITPSTPEELERVRQELDQAPEFVSPSETITSEGSEPVAAETSPLSTSAEAAGRFEAALSQEKGSYALQLLLGKEDYSSFLRDMHLSSGALDKISKMNYTEFMDQYNNSDSFRDTYREIATMVKREHLPAMDKLNMKNVLVAILKVRQEKGLI